MPPPSAGHCQRGAVVVCCLCAVCLGEKTRKWLWPPELGEETAEFQPALLSGLAVGCLLHGPSVPPPRGSCGMLTSVGGRLRATPNTAATLAAGPPNPSPGCALLCAHPVWPSLAAQTPPCVPALHCRARLITHSLASVHPGGPWLSNHNWPLPPCPAHSSPGVCALPSQALGGVSGPHLSCSPRSGGVVGCSKQRSRCPRSVEG